MYLTGLSMGGFGTFDILSRRPNQFAAAIAICGGSDLKVVDRYKHVPMLIAHGAKDDVVPVENSRAVVKKLRSLGNNAQYIEYQDGGHGVWNQAFEEPNTLPWLFAQRK